MIIDYICKTCGYVSEYWDFWDYEICDKETGIYIDKFKCPKCGSVDVKENNIDD